MCAVVYFQSPYPMHCPLYGITLVKKPVVLNVYKQKTPLLGGAFNRLIWSPKLLQMERAFAGHILWL